MDLIWLRSAWNAGPAVFCAHPPRASFHRPFPPSRRAGVNAGWEEIVREKRRPRGRYKEERSRRIRRSSRTEVERLCPLVSSHRLNSWPVCLRAGVRKESTPLPVCAQGRGKEISGEHQPQQENDSFPAAAGNNRSPQHHRLVVSLCIRIIHGIRSIRGINFNIEGLLILTNVRVGIFVSYKWAKGLLSEARETTPSLLRWRARDWRNKLRNVSGDVANEGQQGRLFRRREKLDCIGEHFPSCDSPPRFFPLVEPGGISPRSTPHFSFRK